MVLPVVALSYIPIQFAGFATSIMTKSIIGLYGMGKDINGFIDSHIEVMKSSKTLSVSRVGAVLEAAKFGFGLGYLSSVTILCVGQLLLGNSLQAVSIFAQTATLSNPTAMTCAAVGAVYFGWNALSDDEKNDLLDKLSSGLSIGIEFIKAIIDFFNRKLKELNDSAIFIEIKENIYAAADLFGKKLSDVTKSTKDKILEITKSFLAHVPKFKLPNLDLNGDGKINLDDFFPRKPEILKDSENALVIRQRNKTVSKTKDQITPTAPKIQNIQKFESSNQQIKKRKSKLSPDKP